VTFSNRRSKLTTAALSRSFFALSLATATIVAVTRGRASGASPNAALAKASADTGLATGKSDAYNDTASTRGSAHAEPDIGDP
jgi:hypothetical protein